MSVDKLAEISLDFLTCQKSQIREMGDGWLEKVLSLLKERITKLTDIPDLIKVFLPGEIVYDIQILAWKKSDLADAKNKLSEAKKLLESISYEQWTMEEIEKTITNWINKNSYDRGAVLWPLRVALSGEKQSPGPFELAYGLGKVETIRRIESAIVKI
jgi:glutamyl-tRNA synthetase